MFGNDFLAEFECLGSWNYLVQRLFELLAYASKFFAFLD